MALHWMHLLPVDRYFVRTSSVINETDKEIITLLYQPLIGALAHSLYFCLLSELERDQFTSKETTHKTLMTMTGIHLDKIFEERKKLEGIGLLNVYKRSNDEITYLYELQKPCSPVEFFKDDVLSVYLYNRVGKRRYLQLRERFTLDKLNKQEFKEMTVSFSDVFTSLHHSEISAKQGELASALEIDENSEIVSNEYESSYEISESTFDFSLLIAHLSNMIDPQKLLTDKVKDTIIRLAFMYRTEPLEMSRIIQDSLLQDDSVDLEVMREKVKSWYRFTYDNEPPALGLRTHPEKYRTMVGITPSNEEEEMILYYETESPLTLLETKSAGTKVPLSDVKIVESLLLDYKLLPGVANVLIDYVLEINDMNLTKAFVEKIAAQWVRKNIKQVKEAMELAKSEFRKRDEWKQAAKETAQAKDKPGKRPNNRYVRKDRLPKWLTEEEAKKSDSVEYDGDIEKLKAELDQKMQQFKSQGEV